MSEMTDFPLICPRCHHRLEVKETELFCSLCSLSFPREGNVVDFASVFCPEDDFFSYYNGGFQSFVPDLDLDHIPWKFDQFLKILENHQIEIKNVIDGGAGSGLMLSRIKESFPDTRRVYLDISRQNLDFAFDRKTADLYIQSSLKEIPFEDNFFDIGLLVDVLEHLPDLEDSLREISRVCRYLFIKIPLESCLEGWVTRKILPDWRDRFGHINFFDLKSFRQILDSNNLSVCEEIICRTPQNLWNLSQASLREKMFLKIRDMTYFLIGDLYRYFFPMWYFALVSSSAEHD